MPKKWTADEEEYLRQEMVAGASIMSMAQVLERSYYAVVRRLRLMRDREQLARRVQREKREMELIGEEG